jgi:hypothetical protein
MLHRVSISHDITFCIQNSKFILTSLHCIALQSYLHFILFYFIILYCIVLYCVHVRDCGCACRAKTVYDETNVGR